MDKKSEHIREVFAHYGLALYLAQCIEKGICILLSGQYAPTSPEKMTRWRYEELLDGHMQLSFGQVMTKLKSVMELPPTFEENLKKAVENRNLLAHSYWWERAVDFATFEGRERMLLELSDFINEFERLNNIFDTIQKNWMETIGFPMQAIDLEKLKTQIASEKENKQIRRRLKKRELLNHVYTYLSINDSGKHTETPIFELEDGTFWTLGDCGLTYAPAYIKRENLSRDPKCEKILHTNFNPCPKNAKNWSYSLIFDNGFIINVSPWKNEGSFAFKWRIQKKQ